MNRSELARIMIEFRAKYDLSQSELAKMCRLTPQTIWNLENQKGGCTKLTMAKILNVIREGGENG